MIEERVQLAIEARDMWDIARDKAASEIMWDNLTLSDILSKLKNADRFKYIRNLLGYKLNDIYSWPKLVANESKKKVNGVNV